MTQRGIKIGLGFAILFQFVVLVGGYISAALPLWIGKEIKIETIPVDPRSILRGDYVRLNYAISQIQIDEFPKSENWRQGEIVYVHLNPGTDDLYRFNGITLKPPQKRVFLRGRITKIGIDNFRVKYGIEAFFAPQKTARELEKQFAHHGGVAILMVTDTGKAALKKVIPVQQKKQNRKRWKK